MANEKFPPVGLLSPLAPVDHPQGINPGVNVLPPNAARPARRQYQSGVSLLAPSGLTPSSVPLTPGSATDANTRDLHHYANIIEGVFPVPVLSGALGSFLQEPSGFRNFLLIRNSGATNIYIGFGNYASVSSMLLLATGQTVLFDMVVPQDELFAFSDAAGGTISFGYSTIPNN